VDKASGPCEEGKKGNDSEGESAARLSKHVEVQPDLPRERTGGRETGRDENRKKNARWNVKRGGGGGLSGVSHGVDTVEMQVAFPVTSRPVKGIKDHSGSEG